MATYYFILLFYCPSYPYMHICSVCMCVCVYAHLTGRVQLSQWAAAATNVHTNKKRTCNINMHTQIVIINCFFVIHGRISKAFIGINAHINGTIMIQPICKAKCHCLLYCSCFSLFVVFHFCFRVCFFRCCRTFSTGYQ